MFTAARTPADINFWSVIAQTDRQTQTHALHYIRKLFIVA